MGAISYQAKKEGKNWKCRDDESAQKGQILYDSTYEAFWTIMLSNDVCQVGKELTGGTQKALGGAVLFCVESCSSNGGDITH